MIKTEFQKGEAMRIRDITQGTDKFLDMLESATSGATSAASIATVPGAMGAINRRPSLFGYIPQDQPARKSKKRKK